MTHFGQKKTIFVLYSKIAACIKKLNSKFQKCISFRFRVTNFFTHLCHYVSFIELTRNGGRRCVTLLARQLAAIAQHRVGTELKRSPLAPAKNVLEHWDMLRRVQNPTTHTMCHKFKMSNSKPTVRPPRRRYTY